MQRKLLIKINEDNSMSVKDIVVWMSLVAEKYFFLRKSFNHFTFVCLQTIFQTSANIAQKCRAAYFLFDWNKSEIFTSLNCMTCHVFYFVLVLFLRCAVHFSFVIIWCDRTMWNSTPLKHNNFKVKKMRIDGANKKNAFSLCHLRNFWLWFV